MCGDNMKKLAVGIMTGTSLDGIDVVVVEIEEIKNDSKYRTIYFETFDYEEDLLEKVRKSLSIEESNSELICSLNFELGIAYGEAVKKICNLYKIDLNDIDFIASHGQTIYHISENYNGYIKSSLQLGEGSVIANICNTTVVSNFRCADISVGGQGAPLVPYADYVLFNDKNVSRVINNIGGISNVTVLDKLGNIDDIIAFDTGVGNMMIDYTCKKLLNINYDNKGLIARSGKVIDQLLGELLTHKFLFKYPPKSTGREEFGDQFTETIINRYRDFKPKDIICTLTHFTASSIVSAYKSYILKDVDIDEVIISGGGAYNDYLIEILKEKFANIKVLILEDLGMNSSSKEALAFVVLGNETLNMNSSNVKSATGAKRNVILGQVNYVFKN
jgi:anhydro-N-acetylmuramic acid kinase